MTWSKEKAHAWYNRQNWIIGCNFIPSTAINQLEMWQDDTFDIKTIKRELEWASLLGFNSVRIYLHDLAWQDDKAGLKKRIDLFLSTTNALHIKPMFVLFDDCWNDNPQIGKQPDPKPGVHNSGWLRSPGSKGVEDKHEWKRLEAYVQDILKTFSTDDRILMWDLYNEPCNSKMELRSLPLLKETFNWAREIDPIQPLTCGIWQQEFKEYNAFQIEASDIVTFHAYGDAQLLEQQIASYKASEKPIICTEFMARTANSLFQTHLPIFYREKVGCYNWGLVSGKTQTIFPWGSKEGSPEPAIWFHDIFRADGSPFSKEEVTCIKKHTGNIN